MTRATYVLEDGRTAVDCPLSAPGDLHPAAVERRGDDVTVRCWNPGCDPADVRHALVVSGLYGRILDELGSPIGEPSATEEATSWAVVDLEPVLDGRTLDEPPSMLGRGDGVQLLYTAKVHQVSGEPESCKGWLALRATADLILAGREVVYVDFEDTEATIVPRLRALGCSPAQIIEWLRYVRPHEPLTDRARVDLDQALEASPALVVIDGVTEALTIHGLDLGDNADVARWLELLPRPVVRGGAAVLLIDHVVKDREARGRFAIGAQHKLAGIDVAYGLEVIEPFGRGRDGLIKVTVAKDRPGHVRQHADEGRIADMHLSSGADGRVTVDLRAPDAPAVFRPTVLMGRVSEAVIAEPGLSTNGIERGVKGKAATVREAVRLLIAEKYIEPRREGAARCHYSLRPFTDEPNLVPTSRPRPDHVPDAPRPNLVPRPSPVGEDETGDETNGAAPNDQPRPSSCTCERPARSPRANGPDLCQSCKRPMAPLEAVA